MIDQSPAARAPERGSRGPAAVLGVLVVALAVAMAILLVRWPDSSGSRPADDSAAAGFSRDMQVHHAQAVDMSMIVRDRTEDVDIRRLGYDIALTQQAQIGEMAGWLRFWKLSQTNPGKPMAWMGADHAGHSMPGMGAGVEMPGMATAADLEQLAELSGREAELKYLTLMVAHHRGGVAMAQALLDRSEVQIVRVLAEKMVAGQNSEIDLMNDLIAARGGTRV
ncbi:MAG: DUF305 domain-containing protein [Sporichthyaceae bacterium]